MGTRLRKEECRTKSKQRRALAAPAGASGSWSSPKSTKTLVLESPRAVSPVCSRGGISLPKRLEPLDRVRACDYCGPTDESNWVLPGRLMVGAFPGVAADAENDKVLTSLLEAGVTTFVCLQKEYDPFATEEEWRRGSSIRPYFDSAVEISARLDQARRLAFLHFGIEDCSVGEDSDVAQFAIDLANRLRHTDEVVYLHCWGGHGRTGTVVCLLLHLLYGLDDADAFVRCQYLHDTRRLPIDVGSPQTLKQREQVSRIIRDLERQSLLAPPPPPIHHHNPPRHDEKVPPKLVPNQVSFDENDYKAFTSKRDEEDDVAFLPHLVYSEEPTKHAKPATLSSTAARRPEYKNDVAPNTATTGNKKSASPRSRHGRLYAQRQRAFSVS